METKNFNNTDNVEQTIQTNDNNNGNTDNCGKLIISSGNAGYIGAFCKIIVDGNEVGTIKSGS